MDIDMLEEGISIPEQLEASPEILFQFSQHTLGPENVEAYQSKTLRGDVEVHPWTNEALMKRLKEINPRVLCIDGATPGFNPAADDGQPIGLKENRMFDNAYAHAPWLWFLQPAKPSEYADIDLSDPDHDHIFHVTADITADSRNIFKYLLAYKQNAAVDEVFASPLQGRVNLTDFRFTDVNKDETSVKKMFYYAALFGGLSMGMIPHVARSRETMSRRSFLKGFGIASAGLALSAMLNGSYSHIQSQQEMAEVMQQLMRSIASAQTVDESIELQKIIDASFHKLDDEQNPAIIKIQGRSAIAAAKNEDALQQLLLSGKSIADISPSVLLFGNAHAPEADTVLHDVEGRNDLIERYGNYIFQGLLNFNGNVSVSNKSNIRGLEMSSQELINLESALINLIGLTSVQRVYDPQSITIRDEMNQSTLDRYHKYNLLVQPEKSFVSPTIRQVLSPLLNNQII